VVVVAAAATIVGGLLAADYWPTGTCGCAGAGVGAAGGVALPAGAVPPAGAVVVPPVTGAGAAGG